MFADKFCINELDLASSQRATVSLLAEGDGFEKIL